MEKIKCAAVVGPTASGKTALAVELAKRLNGEIVSADSMQIYREMQIATAKPTAEEMQGIPHHLMDFIDPEEEFSVSDYVERAREAVADIAARGKLPILCGGTGLYVSSFFNNVQFDEMDADKARREELYRQARADQGQALYRRLQQIDPISAERIHPNNIIRVVRAIEVYEATGKTMTQLQQESLRQPSPYDECIIGLAYEDRAVLYDRVNRRVDLMMEQGLLEEARQVLQNEHLKTAANAIGYKELRPYFRGELPLEVCVEHLKQETRRYAKRQLTWFRRDSRISWIYPDKFDDFEEVVKISEKILVKHYHL